MSTGAYRTPLFIGLFSAGVLSSEIILTRIFSVVYWYHFGFLVLSTAMLGFGIGGFLVRRKSGQLKSHASHNVLATGSISAGCALIAALLALTNNPFHVSDPATSPGTITLFMAFELVSSSLVLLIPFLFMGAVIVFTLQTEHKKMGSVYGANLIGSALGCLLALVLMNILGGVKSLIAVSALLTSTGSITAFTKNHKTAGVSLLTALIIVSFMLFSDALFPIKSPTGKPAATIEPSQKLKTDWTSLSRVDFYKEKDSQTNEFGLWGLSPANTAPLPERLGVLIDYWAYTTILSHSDKPGFYDFMDNLPMYGMYRISQTNPDMMVIGSGGGMDIRAALRAGASHIDAVEINPSIYNAMTRDYASYSGNVYRNPKVTAYLGEGRSVLSSMDKTYDIIQLSGVDTFSATQAGAFALTENYLYTLEAFQNYLNHLNPDGILSVTHWYIPSTTGYPRYSLRLFSLAYSALQGYGVQNPADHMYFYQSKRFAVLIVKKTPLSHADIASLSNFCTEKQFVPIYRPDKVIFSSMKFYSFITSADKKAWLQSYPFNVTPPTDSSPFYFENRKFTTLFNPGDFIEGYIRFDGQTILGILFIEMIVASLWLVVGSFRLERSNRDVGGWIYFSCIGMGFMLAEVSFTQQMVLFLGHPVYALSVVLFSILLFSGIGAFFSRQLTSRFSFPAVLSTVCVIFLIQAAFGIPFLRELGGLHSFGLKLVVAVLFLGPVSCLMGTAFPEAARRICARGNDQSLGLPWAFNSFASVIGSVTAILLAIVSGFTLVMVCAGACYILAALVAPRNIVN